MTSDQSSSLAASGSKSRCRAERGTKARAVALLSALFTMLSPALVVGLAVGVVGVVIVGVSKLGGVPR